MSQGGEGGELHGHQRLDRPKLARVRRFSFMVQKV